SILKKIILVTFIIEGFGTILIFQSLDVTIIQSVYERIFFSVFHSISGFCNAGFSTLQNSFYETPYQFNYAIHIIIAVLIIFGGLGFPIVFNLLKYLQVKIKSFFLSLFRIKHNIFIPWLININTRIVLITSLLLTVFGALMFFIFEYDNTLSNHNLIGKIITSFFQSVTARTAGFNTVDTSSLTAATLLIVLFLMWIGASPGSTGGGIKTSTLALAILNIISIAKGKSRLEVFKREISQTSINRAFAIMILSIFGISISTIFIYIFDSEKGLMNIFFECVSAYGTVGLSRGITADLCNASKIILIFTMFIGRISMLTLLIAFFKKVSSERYRYPSDNILIN
ncbi:MAG: potassium transporter TrkG, partial [Bacteroidota bacterium]